MAGKAKHALGIDLGGTRIKALAVTTRGKVLAEYTSRTDDTGDDSWTANVRRTVELIRKRVGADPTWIGVAAPGLPAKNGQSIACMPGRLRGLERLSWQRFLRFEDPVPVLNDSQAALLGEAWLGAAQGAENVALLTLGTGVGGAAMVDGRLLRGHIGRAGHLGHISLNPEGAQDVANTPGSLEWAIGECSLHVRSNGRFHSTARLVAAATNGDELAKRIWLASVQALAAAVSSIVNVLDPELVVIGGGISNAGKALFRPLTRFMNRFEWRPGGCKVSIVSARLGDRAGAFGAAWNAMQRENSIRG